MANEVPTRNLAMELVRTTEAAALAPSNWVGRGDKEGADGAAVDAMRLILGTVSMTGTVIIGEGEKDEAPMLYNGEVVGDGSAPNVDIAVDPDRRHHAHLQGPRRRRGRDRRVRGRHDVRPGSHACTWRRSRSEPEAADVVDLNASVGDNIRAVAKAKGIEVREVTAVILDRPRHDDMIDEIRSAGRPHPPHHRRRRRRRHRHRHPRLRRGHPVRRRWDARGRDRRRGAQVHGRRTGRSVGGP